MADTTDSSDLQFPADGSSQEDFEATHVVDKNALEFPSMDDSGAGAPTAATTPITPSAPDTCATPDSGATQVMPPSAAGAAGSAGVNGVGRHAANTADATATSLFPDAANDEATQLLGDTTGSTGSTDVIGSTSINPPLPPHVEETIAQTRVASSAWEPAEDSSTSVLPAFRPATPPVIPPASDDFGGDEGDDPNGTPHHANDSAKKSHTKLIVGITAGVVAVALIAGGIVWWNHSRTSSARSKAYSLCENAQNSYKDAQSALQASLKTANGLTGTAADQVADSATIDTLKTAVSDAQQLQDKSITACAADAQTTSLTATTEVFRSTTTSMNDAKTKLDNAVNALNASKTSKAQSTNRDNLNNAIDEAQKVLDASAGLVADEQTRTDLQTQIDNAKKLLDNQNLSSNDVTNAMKSLTDASTAVTDSQSAYSAQLAAQQAQQQALNNTTGTGDGTGTDTGDGAGNNTGTDGNATNNGDGANNTGDGTNQDATGQTTDGNANPQS